MARAKRTDRTEARRKYRAYLQAEAEAEAGTATGTEEDSPAPARRSLFGMGSRPAASTSPASTARATTAAVAARPRTAPSAPVETPPTGQMNFFKAMGAAYKPVHYRDDLRFLPILLTRTFGVWAGIALVIAGTTVYLTDPNVDDFWVGIAALTLAPMPLVPVMLAGVMTQRAAWLAGAISGAAGGIGSAIILQAQPDKVVALIHTTQGERLAIGLQYILIGACFGALFGALSAWYRRFLTLSMGPNKRQQQSKRSARSSSRSTSRPVKRPTR